jgi:hypothetical protein
MDSLRGLFNSLGSLSASGSHDDDLGQEIFDDAADDPVVAEPPPSPVGQDERRMQVRAYNYWAGMLGERNFPAIEDLDPNDLPDFGPYSVLLDFTKGIENPGVPFLGDRLAVECGGDVAISQLDDVPSLSLLSRITDHYMQILANQAPIGFEAEFVNGRGLTVLYRGILLPFSSNDETIDYIYGVINWKELADQQTANALLQEIDGALRGGTGNLALAEPQPEPQAQGEAVLDLGAIGMLADEDEDAQELTLAQWDDKEVDFDDVPLFAQPEFGDEDVSVEDYEEGEDEAEDAGQPSLIAMNVDKSARRKAAVAIDLTAMAHAPVIRQVANGAPVIETFTETAFVDGGHAWQDYTVPDASVENLPVLHSGRGTAPVQADTPAAMLERIAAAMSADEEATGLHDCLASARELADAARNSEDRTRGALYKAMSRAYDFSLAAADAPEDFAELLADSGLAMQERAPMTPVVKLVFGTDYDKTRLAEYATVLTHAQRCGVERGGLKTLLQQTPGGLKGLVSAERRLRREKAGQKLPVHGAGEALAEKLRALPPMTLAQLNPDGAEFAMVMVRRMPDGTMAVLGEVPEDAALFNKAARRLLA